MSREDKLSRGKFIRWGLAGLGALGGLQILNWQGVFSSDKKVIPGKILGANAKVGHLLREAINTPVTQQKEHTVIIVGGGIAGLSAARELKRQGIEDFILLELDEKPGGNAASGESNGFRYPWGAHYLPLPNLDNRDLLDLLEELSCITGYENGLPIYDELFLCHAPQERLLIHGLWQDGLVPKTGVPKEDKAEIERFFKFTNEQKGKLGPDEKPLFTIPLDKSSNSSDWKEIDRQSFADWLSQHGYNSEYLRWYLNYCCRDDFGSTLETTSAWAGIHYFASRNGFAANSGPNAVLTWPEGNGWLAGKLADSLRAQIQCNSLAFSLNQDESGVRVKSMNTQSKEVSEFRAKKVIFAGPQFLRKYTMPESAPDLEAFSYGPWMVANVHLNKRPTGKGRPLSWDNVAYETDSLGYIVADHQSLVHGPSTVLTWYKALTDEAPEVERKAALARTYDEWQAMVVKDLEWMHPGITKDIQQLDVWVWGHGMIRPEPGFISGEARRIACEPVGSVHFAHSDLSGISIFEEAFAQGLRAAREVLEGGLS